MSEIPERYVWVGSKYGRIIFDNVTKQMVARVTHLDAIEIQRLTSELNKLSQHVRDINGWNLLAGTV